MKTPRSKKPKSSLRQQVSAAVLSEIGRQAVKLIGTVAIAVIMQHLGSTDAVPHLLMV